MTTSPVSSEANRQLTIKLNVLRRCTKELDFYEKEYATQATTLHTQVFDCPYERRKHEEALRETERILPGCNKRVLEAKASLYEFLSTGAGIDVDHSLRDQAQELLQ